MSPVDDLSPDQRAVLALLLQQAKRYDDLGRLLRIDAASVRARAIGALEALAPPDVEIPAGRRAELSDWLLGQQDPAETTQTLEHLAGSPTARDWATGASAALREGGFAPDALPDVPPAPAPDPAAEAGATAAAEPSARTEPATGAGASPAVDATAETGAAAGDGEAETRLPGFAPESSQRPPSSRIGGALLIAGIVIVLAAALVWALTDDDGDAESPTVAATQTTTAAADPEIVAQINLRAPGGGEALGVANVLAQGDQRAVAIQGQDLRRNTKDDAYAVWLAGGPGGAATRLGFAPAVGRNGRLEGASALPEDAADYRRLVISLESDTDPQKPTTVVLTGKLDLG